MPAELLSLNTLRVRCEADELTVAGSASVACTTIRQALDRAQPVTLLGGGSNVILRRRIPGHVLVLRNGGVSVHARDRHSVLVDVGAGESWPALVRSTLANGWYGLENLALIPGTAGAAPIQNIGAYGVEVRERLDSVHVINRLTGEERRFTNDECAFGYRTSRFKVSSEWLILSIRLRLCLQPDLKLDYPDVATAVRAHPLNQVSPSLVADVVSDIRRSKLPDPEHVGNVGSFFKNPVITLREARALTTKHAWVRTFPVDQTDHHVKLSAAQLIDKSDMVWVSGICSRWCWSMQVPLQVPIFWRWPAPSKPISLTGLVWRWTWSPQCWVRIDWTVAGCLQPAISLHAPVV
jgi:UDP-N-acetylmuramate dehydrogenase